MTSFAAFADEYFPPRPKAAAAPAPRPATSESLAFSHALVALAAQLAAVDGTPQPSEYRAFHGLFVAEDGTDEQKLRSLFVKHAGTGAPGLQYARQITAITTGQEGLRQEIFARLVRIATADGALNAAEMEWLRAVGAAFDLGTDWVRAQIAHCFTHTGSSPYAVLGVRASVDDAALRRAYMARVQALHPDRFQAAGASAETIALLSGQLAAVNAAYEAACKTRSKKSTRPRFWTRRDKSAEAFA